MWFDQGIVNALNKSKNQQLILMVYIVGENEASKQMTDQLENDEDIKSLVNRKAIALKLIENSNDAKLFNQIYAHQPSPTIYVISHLGNLLNTFSQKLDKDAFVKLLNESNGNVTSSDSTIIDQNKQSSKNEQQSTSVVASSSTGDNRSIEEKRKELIERIKEKNAKEEAERAKNRELERIRSGKELQKLRKNREQEEQAELIRQREKDALFDKAERERVLRAVEEDRQEKKERFEQERLKREEEYSKYQKEQAEKNALKNRTTIKVAENEIKIQFRLSDGNSLICKFKNDETLLQAFNYVKENSDLVNFQFALTYPKRNFNSNDFNSTFNDLGIKNSAVLLVLEDESTKKSAKSSARSSISGSVGENNGESIIGKLYSIVLFIYMLLFNLITSLFSGLFNSNRNPSNTEASTDNNQQPPFDSSNRRRGFRSNFDHDNDDSNRTNTYNGNSTEQQ